MYIDIHTHQAGNTASQLSVQNIIVKPAEKIETESKQFYSLGIHPWYIDELQIEQQLTLLYQYVKNRNVIAIGETGLDKIRGVALNLQEMIFRKHIDLSEKYRKPLIVHCVKAFNEIIKIKKELKPTQAWIVHGFRQNNQVAEQLINNGFMLSLGHFILSSDSYDPLIANYLDKNYFFETDEADAGFLPNVYQKVAQLKGISVDELKKQQIVNFEQIFNVKLNARTNLAAKN